MNVVGTRLFETATSNWQRIPREGWLLALVAGALSSGADIWLWAHGQHPSWVVATLALPSIIVSFVAVYVGALGVLKKVPTLSGCFRFVGASVVLLLPLAGTVVLLLVGKSLLAEGDRVTLLLLGVVVEVIILGLLPA